ncbi:phytoene/squalene synthase family protein [Bartonella sp. CB178]|uniref:phytoene/squalene synthase family protein n=1 Tax=Bartonella sp. CB178 TaxID=3112255 RepID=UPI00300E3AF8
MITSLPYCLEILRKTDRDRYISVLFAPREKRRALAALYAFNTEIVRIRESVHDPLIGEIRLRWWYDTIANSEVKKGTNSPILDDLFAAIVSFNLPKSAFLRYCDAQILDIHRKSIETIYDFELYCGETVSVILQLACQILEPDLDAAQELTDVCKHGGISQGASGILRLLSFMRPRYQHYLPFDMLKAVGVDREELEFNRVSDEKKRRIVDTMVALSREHYVQFYKHSVVLSKALKLAFLPLAIMPASLRKASRLGAAAFQESVTLPLLFRYLLITKAAMKRDFPEILIK